MTDEKTESPALPDRLSTNPASPFHNAELLERGVATVSLFDGDTEIYGHMGLAAP